MASRTSTPQSRSRSASGSSSSSDVTMLEPQAQFPSRPVHLRHPSTSNPSTAAQTAPSDPSFSLLLSLPRELRERIYAFTLTSSYPFWWPNQAPMRHNVGVNLLRTNKQIYQESVALLYSHNKFLFTHPSDCNIFRIVASPASENISCVYFRIREKDLRLWTSYLSSKTLERSLKFDLPKLKSLWIFMRCGSMGTPAMLGQLGHGGMGMQGGGLAGLPPAVVVQVQAAHNALGQQVQALQQQVQNLANSMTPAQGVGAQQGAIPPPPPAPLMTFAQFQQAHQHPPQHHHIPHQQPNHPHPHTLYTSFLRFEREMGIESLCLSLQDTRHKDTEVKIVCIMRVPKREMERLCRLYPEELELDRYGDARTRFRKLHGAEVSLEINGYDIPSTQHVQG